MSELPTLVEVMRDVESLERAPSKEAADLARSLIAMKVARLTGEGVQAAFDVLRPAPAAPMKVRTGHGAVRLVTAMKDAPLDQVVAGLVERLELVPVKSCSRCGGIAGAVAPSEPVFHGFGSPAPCACDADVPWVMP